MKNQPRIPTRAAIPLNNSGAVMSVINRALTVDAVRIALGGFIEGRGLPGDWQLEIQAARLVPVDKPSPPADAN